MEFTHDCGRPGDPMGARNFNPSDGTPNGRTFADTATVIERNWVKWKNDLTDLRNPFQVYSLRRSRQNVGPTTSF